jgi:hypothetical protein
MRPEEAKEAIDAMKEQGKSDEELLYALYGMFKDDKINVDELGDLVQLVGYELTDEFKNMSPDQQKTQGITEEENVDKQQDEVVEGKEPNEPSASKVETKEENNDKDNNKDDESSSSLPSSSPSDDLTPEEEEKARSLYGFK